MAEPSPSAAARIDAAISRIEAAVAARAADARTLAQRHATLRERMTEAVASLDDAIGCAPVADAKPAAPRGKRD